MKKILLLAALVLTSIAAMAKTADELRVYINPGHGSYTPNDRPMAVRGHGPYSRTNTDTTSFFESNTNLRKGFGILEKLRAMGLRFDPSLNQEGERWQIGAARDLSNNIVMSHVKCGPYHEDNGTENQFKNEGKPIPEDLYYYNRSLTEIDIEVDSNNFDMFISIHSNALDGSGWKTTNFPIVLYRGYDDCHGEDGVEAEHSATCKAMAQKVWPYHMGNIHEAWTAYSATNPNIRGDINFYGSSSTARGYKGYLGVLKHGVPGFLIEGYFHQYAPAALRHMNWDVNYVEGFNYAHGIADFFGIEKEKVGDIYGIVRDQHERFRDDTYVPVATHDDVYKPLDGVLVTLKKGDQTVATYTTDNQFNGAFVFRNVEPGDYTLEFSVEGYKSPAPVAVSVKAAEVSYPTAFMESESYVPPTVTYTDYPDLLEGTGFGARSEYAFDNTKADVAVAELEGCTVARMLHQNGRLYILAFDAENNARIVVLDATTLATLATPGTEGCEGTAKNLADIALTADGILIGSAKELCHFSDGQVEPGETRGEANIYRWTNNEAGIPEGNPELWVSTKLSANMYRAHTGESIAYTGTMAEGRLLISSENASTGAAKRVWFNVLDIVDGVKVSESHRNKVFDNAYFDYSALGHYRLNISPLGSKYFMIDGTGNVAATANMDNIPEDYALMGEELLDKLSNNHGYFRYSGHSYMVAPDNTAEGNGGVLLFDITDGLDKATLVPTQNSSLAIAENTSADGVAAAGATLAKVDDFGEVVSANMALFLVRGNKVTRFTTEGVRQPQPRREYAYGITVAEDGDQYKVSFNSTGNAPAAAIVLTKTDNAEETFVIGNQAVTKGANELSFAKADVPAGRYNVAVKITSAPIAEFAEYYDDNNGVAKRGGVITITDPESDNLGYTVVATGSNLGVKVYAPDGTVTGPFLAGDPRLDGGNQSSMFRGDDRNGMAVFADWSDKGAGYWVIDPSNPVDMTQLLAGEREGTKGAYAFNGTIIGGGNSCVAFQGTGDNTRVYSFIEDYPNGNTPGKENKVYAYNIGSDEQITRIPDQVYENLNGGSLLANQNVDITILNDNAFIASQCRGEGNNLAGTPGFVIVSNEGETLLNSSSIEAITATSSGIAVSCDGKLMAVGQYSCITVFDIEYNEYNEPILTKKFNYTLPSTIGWSHMKFDIGGNLHVYMRELGGYHAYSLPSENPESIVPAKAQYIVEGIGSGVEDITIEEVADEADAVYYNINGVRVDATNLTPGVYVKVVGTTATKVMVR